MMPLMTMCDSTQLADYALPLIETLSKWNVPILKGVGSLVLVLFNNHSSCRRSTG